MSVELNVSHNETPSATTSNTSNTPASTGAEAKTAFDEHSSADSVPQLAALPLDSSDIILTPRQRRALNYLARRRMHHARILKRKTLADLKPLSDTLIPDVIVPGPSQDNMPVPDTTPTPAPVIYNSEAPTLVIDTPTPSVTLTSTDAALPAVDEPEAPTLITDTPAPHTPLAPDNTNVVAGLAPARSPVPDTPDNTNVVAGLTPARSPARRLRYLPPMPPLPPRRAAARPAYKAQVQLDIVGTRQRKYSQPHTLTKRQKLLGHLSRKHLRHARVTEHRVRQRFWTTVWSITAVLMIIFVSLGAVGSLTVYNFFHQTQTKYEHQVDALRSLLPPDNLKIFDSKGVLLAQRTDQGLHTTVKFDQISPLLRNATVVTEDKNFWTNQGIDLLRIVRAALDDLEHGRIVEGGSTITQQLIKNLVVGNQPTLIRKLEEVVLTPQVNSRYSKRDILEMYLNSIYYGHQAYGIDAAATVYFGLQDKPGQSAALQLDLAQSAMLAGIPSNPYEYDPLLHPQATFGRFAIVLGQMETQGYITKVQAIDAMREAQDPHFFKTGVALRNRAPHFVDFVLLQLQQMFHLKNRSSLSRSGMVVYTTLDINLQDKIQKIAQQHIAELRDAHHLTNAAEVLIDFHSGAIISLLGSIDYNNTSIDGQFDVATSYRQPGSSFKPYVYVTAFEQGISPAQAIDDQPITILLPGGDPPTFTPRNYDLGYHGHMTLRCALQNSLNIPAVKVLTHIGIDAAMRTAYNMGITSYQGTPGYSLVLGGLGIRLIDHTSAMGTFANGGVHVPYHAINKVIFATTGKVIFQHQLDPGKRVISPQLAYMMTSVLSDNESRIPEFLDCNVLQLYANSQQDCYNGNRGGVRPAAAKTGTTNDFRDNWTVGYTTDYVMGVWAGNDDNSPMVDVTGVQGAAPIWHDAMLLAEQGHPIRDFANPGGLIQATVTYPDGVRTTDWFLPGTVPTYTPPEPTPAPTPIATGTPLPQPAPNPTPVQPARVPPYCPSSYSFAFAPPPIDKPPASGWW